MPRATDTVGPDAQELAFWEQVYLTSLAAGATAGGAKAFAEQALTDRRELIAALQVEDALQCSALRRAEEYIGTKRHVMAIQALRAEAGMDMTTAKDAVDYRMRVGEWPPWFRRRMGLS